jgi:hypothetical protein
VRRRKRPRKCPRNPGRLSIAGVCVRRHDDRADQARDHEDVTTMMFYDMSQQYHAERTRTAAEQRRADEQAGLLAAGVSRRWQRLTRPARALRARSSRRAAYAR